MVWMSLSSFLFKAQPPVEQQQRESQTQVPADLMKYHPSPDRAKHKVKDLLLIEVIKPRFPVLQKMKTDRVTVYSYRPRVTQRMETQG